MNTILYIFGFAHKLNPNGYSDYVWVFRQYNQNFHHFSGIHESLYCIIAIGLETIAGLSLPFVKSLNEYYGIQVLTIVQYGVWANARTLITFCIESNEIGKVYASVGIGKEHASKK